MALAPATATGIALALAGLALLVAAFVSGSVTAVRLMLGIALLVAGMITSGLHLLARHGGEADSEGI